MAEEAELPKYEELERKAHEDAEGVGKALVQGFLAAGVKPRPPPQLRDPDPERLAAKERHINAICELAEKGAAAAWEIGEHYNAIFTGQRARAPRTRETQRYLENRVKGHLKLGTLRQYAVLQKAFSKEALDAYGPARLYRLLVYLNHRHMLVPREKDAVAAVRIPVEYRGQTVLKLFPRCTEREIRQACGEEALAVANGNADLLDRVAQAIWDASCMQVRVGLSAMHGEAVLKIAPIPAFRIEVIAKAMVAAIEKYRQDETAKGSKD